MLVLSRAYTSLAQNGFPASPTAVPSTQMPHKPVVPRRFDVSKLLTAFAPPMPIWPWIAAALGVVAVVTAVVVVTKR